MQYDTPEAERLEIPAAPWRLRGTVYLSVWRIGTDVLPSPGQGVSRLALGNSTLLMTFWSTYTPGGTLHYDELAVAVPVRGRGLLAPALSINWIWVDDEVSAAGGRSLWNIPKEMGHFSNEAGDGRVFSSRLSVDDQPIATLHFKPSFTLPGRWPVSGFVMQPGQGGPVRTRCAAQGQLSAGRATWQFAASGPLSFLRESRPIFSVRISDARMSFGV